MRHSQSKTTVLGILFVLGLVLMTAAPATATTMDTLLLSCTGSTDCSAGATTQVTSSLSGTFGLSNTGGAFTGTAFVVVLEPNVTTFTGNCCFDPTIGQTVPFAAAGFTTGSLDAFITTPTVNLNGFNFGSLASASEQAVGVGTVNSFFVKEWSANTTYTGSNFGSCCTFGTPNHLLPGSVILSFVNGTGANAGDVINTSLSKSLTVGVPEPDFLLLLGAVLIGIGLWHWKRRKELIA